jgi:thiol-disulfide isomerase/thioredoxin
MIRGGPHRSISNELARHALLAVVLTSCSKPAAPPPDAGSAEQIAERFFAEPGVELVAVDVYASWCRPCVEQLPLWQSLHAKYRERGFRMVLVLVADPEEAPWAPDAVVKDPKGAIARELGRGSTSLPMAFLFAKGGKRVVDRGDAAEVLVEVEKRLSAQREAEAPAP